MTTQDDYYMGLKQFEIEMTVHHLQRCVEKLGEFIRDRETRELMVPELTNIIEAELALKLARSRIEATDMATLEAAE